ncbi:MAG: hypothetical protein MRERC_5c070 [Mycoplasmataceae bacterium RC_NB112A]|nr:MAG: hypothetical protein MRERC_5c070 [Mycoplasmataceae bacterium RC_NB112A]
MICKFETLPLRLELNSLLNETLHSLIKLLYYIMVSAQEWLDKNYLNHQNRNIPNIKKLIVNEAIEDLADFSMFIDLEELELVSASDIFSEINIKLKS